MTIYPKHGVENFDSVKIARNVNALTLWTERGAARNAKMLNTDRAWDVFELLEETFFRVIKAGPVEPAPSPISKRSHPERKALTAIINTWVGMAPIHYASARAQVNAHFGVASVDALTVAQVKEAIQYVQGKIDALPVGATPAALAAASTTAEVEEHLAVIRAYAREIMERERRMYFALRDVLPPLRGMTRPLSLRLHKSMDSGFEVLDVALKQVESTARLAGPDGCGSGAGFHHGA